MRINLNQNDSRIRHWNIIDNPCDHKLRDIPQKCTDQLDIKGMVIITDMKGASANHLTLFNISIMKKLITMMEVLIKTLHI